MMERQPCTSKAPQAITHKSFCVIIVPSMLGLGGSVANRMRCVSRGIIYSLVFLMPLVSLPSTLDPLEISKQTLLILLTLSAGLLWLASQLFEKEVRLKRGWMNVIPLLYVGAFAIPAFFSEAPYLSWMGADHQEYMSVATAGALGLFMFLIWNTLHERESHQFMHVALFFSVVLTSTVGLLALFDISLFGLSMGVLALNSVGTLASLTAFLIVATSFFLASFIIHREHDSLIYDGAFGLVERGLIILSVLCTFFFLLVLDSGALWALFVFALISLFVFVFFRAQDFSRHARLFLPLPLLIAAIIFWVWLPGFSFFPVILEATPDIQSSLQIAEKTLEAYSRITGSGPGTYLFDFTQFHDTSLNETSFWNIRLDRASSHALTLLPTVGMFGASLLALLVLVVLFSSTRQFLRSQEHKQYLEHFVYFIPWLVIVVSAFLLPWNMALTTSFGLFTGLLVSQNIRTQTSWPFARSPLAAFVCSFLLLSVSIVLLVSVFVSTQRYRAEIAFTKAVNMDFAGGELQEVVEQLERATMLNSHDDRYWRNLAEALLLRIQEEIAVVGSDQVLESQKIQEVQVLVAASVNAATQATQRSPENVLNWLTLGFVYRELAPFVEGASEFSLASYQRATELESVNPFTWTEFGKAHLVAAQAVSPLMTSQDDSVAREARARFEQFLQGAQKAFEHSIELKSTYAPAHFQLALTYQQQGRLDDAIGKMESVAQYNQSDVGVFFQLGMLYLGRDGMGDQDRAQAAFATAVEIAPSYANAHWFLASIYEAKGDITSAVREVQIVLGLNPDNEAVKSRLDQLLLGQISQEIPEAIEE